MRDTGRVANRALEELPEGDRYSAYASMAYSLVSVEYPIRLPVTGFDLEKLDEATEAMLKRCPESNSILNLAAIVACLRCDQPAAANRIARLAGKYDRSMWKQQQIFEKFRDRAQRKHLPADSEHAFGRLELPASGLVFRQHRRFDFSQ